MKRWEHGLLAELREFETYFSDKIKRPLQIQLVWDVMWTSAEKTMLPPADWTCSTGLYVFADVSTEKGEPSDAPDRHSVIPRLGTTKGRSFGERLGDYSYPEKAPDAYYYDKKNKQRTRWFRYRWLAIIQISENTYPLFYPLALEKFLLEKIHPTENSDGVPLSLRGVPRVFDEQEVQEPPLRP